LKKRIVPAVTLSFLFVIGPRLAGAAGPRAPAAVGPKPPLNVLLITVDTLRPDRLGCYGSRSPATPAIDGLARRGARFTHAFAHNTVTLPSHANILLGLTPAAHGVHDNSNFVVPGEFQTLAEFLKGAGYATGAFIGAFPLDSRFGLTQGFDTYDDNYGTQDPAAEVFVERPADAVIDKAMEWLEAQPGPWFAWVHLCDPHQPYRPPEPFRSRFKDDPYSGEIAYVDQALGKLFSRLGAKGLENKTCTILTGDHGESLGEHGEATHGYFAYNATLWIPLLASFPGIRPAEVATNVGHIDIFPTVCAVLGLEPPAGLQGRSLLPLIRGERLPEKEIYFEALTAYCNRGWAPLRGYIAGPMKFMDSPIPELYDLGTDFSELRDLAQGTDLNSYRRRFEELFAGLGAGERAASRQNLDMETREKLRSLGYLASPQVQSPAAFSPKDDLKVLLPYHAKWMRATAAKQAGRIEQGIELLREIIAERPDFDLAHTHLSNYLKETGQREEALAVLRRALERNPSSLRVISSYGIALVEAGRFDEAVTAFERGLALVDTDPEVWNYLGVAHWKRGRFREAQRCYEKALSLDNNYAIVFNNLGSLYLSEYLAAKDPKILAQAEAEFRGAIRLDPGYASAFNGLGTALKMRGDAAGAVGAWERALELKPDFAYPLYNLGLIRMAEGNRSKALEYLLRYKEKHYGSLAADEKARLDSLIEDCRK
jgi:arylsulfatase A-like enzyme/Flp pilus assembly protein TadD